MSVTDLLVFNPGNQEVEEPGGLIALGTFQFSVDAVTYREIERITQANWAEQTVNGGDSVLQFTGLPSPSISMKGVYYPDLFNGDDRMPQLLFAMEQGEPLSMVDGRGNSLGLWVVLRLTEGLSKFTADGRHRRCEFTIALKRYAR